MKVSVIIFSSGSSSQVSPAAGRHPSSLTHPQPHPFPPAPMFPPAPVAAAPPVSTAPPPPPPNPFSAESLFQSSKSSKNPFYLLILPLVNKKVAFNILGVFFFCLLIWFAIRVRVLFFSHVLIFFITSN